MLSVRPWLGQDLHGPLLPVLSYMGGTQSSCNPLAQEEGDRTLTLPMLRLLSSKVQGQKDFRKPSKPSHVGIQGIALA